MTTVPAIGRHDVAPGQHVRGRAQCLLGLREAFADVVLLRNHLIEQVALGLADLQAGFADLLTCARRQRGRALAHPLELRDLPAELEQPRFRLESALDQRLYARHLLADAVELPFGRRDPGGIALRLGLELHDRLLEDRYTPEIRLAAFREDPLLAGEQLVDAGFGAPRRQRRGEAHCVGALALGAEPRVLGGERVVARLVHLARRT